MAIFAGEWFDADGNPFDPNAVQVQDTLAGGVARVRRTGISPHPMHAPFVAAVRYMADRWHNDLDQGDRDDWNFQGGTGPARRGSLSRSPSNGYIMLNAFDFIQLWADPPSSILQPAVIPPWTWTGFTADSVHLANQTVTFTATADAAPVFPDIRLATFQINPRAVLFTNPWRATRLLDLAVAADFDPGPYNPTVDLAWPVAAGDLVRLYCRGRNDAWWKFEADDTVTA